MTGIGTWWRTLSHLQSRQIVGRVKFRLARPRVDAAPAPTRRAAGSTWVMPPRRAASFEPPAKLRVLNSTYDVDRSGWDDAATDKLLRYNAHYFDDLCAEGAMSRRDAQRRFVQRWIDENPPAAGTGWDPYPTSLRIVNWVKWFLGGEQPVPAWEHSLAIQARWLRGRLETHLLGNHLFVNAKALVFAGAWFAGREADEWLAQGLGILAEEIPEQILPDGGHFERSPMYHALALEDVLDLLNLAKTFPAPAPRLAALERPLRERAATMLHWARCMMLGDGRIGFFNDAAHGIAPDPGELERYAAQLGVEAPRPADETVTPLAESGYVRVARGGALALLDVAPIGPDYLPAHAHADTLSFELSLGEVRVIVNGGTSCYGTGAQRQRERSTAAHSTVEVAGANSSEVWGGFRVGRRARASRAGIDGWTIRGSHDGYRFLPGAPVHLREWRFLAEGLEVRDRVEPAVEPAIARFHLAPGLTLVNERPKQFRILAAGATLAEVDVVRGTGAIESSMHAPRFGETVATQCLAVRLDAGEAQTNFRWSRS